MITNDVLIQLTADVDLTAVLISQQKYVMFIFPGQGSMLQLGMQVMTVLAKLRSITASFLKLMCMVLEQHNTYCNSDCMLAIQKRSHYQYSEDEE